MDFNVVIARSVPRDVYIAPGTFPGMDQAGKWDELYRSQTRAWRGVTDLGDLPFAKGSRILEVGCGNGKTLSALIEEGYDAVGIDFSGEAVAACRRILPEADVRQASVLGLPFGDSEFDGAVMFHVLENIGPSDVPAAVSELRRAVRPGGHVIVRAFAAGDLRSEKGERISDDTVVRGNGIWYRYFTEDSLRGCFPGCTFGYVRTVSKPTRFGGDRSYIEADVIL